MDSTVADCHLGAEPIRLADVAVCHVQDERTADRTLVEQTLHLHVILVIAAHVADLNQTLAVADFGVHDLEALLNRRCERLLTEAILAGLDGGEDIRCVKGVRRRDKNGVDIRRGDQLLARGKRADTEVSGNFLCSFRKKICDAGQRDAGGLTVQTVGMLAADSAASDQSNTNHRIILLYSLALSQFRFPKFRLLLSYHGKGADVDGFFGKNA